MSLQLRFVKTWW